MAENKLISAFSRSALVFSLFLFWFIANYSSGDYDQIMKKGIKLSCCSIESKKNSRKIDNSRRRRWKGKLVVKKQFYKSDTSYIKT